MSKFKRGSSMDGWDADAVVAFTVAWQAGRDAPSMADTKLADAIIQALTREHVIINEADRRGVVDLFDRIRGKQVEMWHRIAVLTSVSYDSTDMLTDATVYDRVMDVLMRWKRAIAGASFSPLSRDAVADGHMRWIRRHRVYGFGVSAAGRATFEGEEVST